VWTGFCSVELAPSPKSHAHDVGSLAEISVNWTVRFVVPEVGVAVKSAFGGKYSEPESGAVLTV